MKDSMLSGLKKLKDWFVNLFNQTVDNITEQTAVEKLESALNNKQKEYKSISDGYYRAKGEEESIKDKIKKADITMKELLETGVEVKREFGEDDPNILKLEVEYQNVYLDKELQEERLKRTQIFVEKLYVLKTNAETYLNDLKFKISELKQKEEMTNKTKEYLSLLDADYSDFDFGEIEDEIDIDFNSTDFKLEDLEKEQEVSKLVKNYKQKEKEKNIPSFRDMLR
jgi:hypothetical protein